MRQIKYIFRNLWFLITHGRYKTPMEKVMDAARAQGYTSIHKVPERYRGKKKYRKAPPIHK